MITKRISKRSSKITHYKLEYIQRIGLRIMYQMNKKFIILINAIMNFSKRRMWTFIIMEMSNQFQKSIIAQIIFVKKRKSMSRHPIWVKREKRAS